MTSYKQVKIIIMKKDKQAIPKKTPSINKLPEVMRKFKEGRLHPSKNDTIVFNNRQAINIALDEAYESKD